MTNSNESASTTTLKPLTQEEIYQRFLARKRGEKPEGYDPYPRDKDGCRIGGDF